MKTKLSSIALVVAAAVFIAASGVYAALLNSRTKSLEARLARVEAALNAKNTAAARIVTVPAALAQQGTSPWTQIPRVGPLGVPRDSLEGRVEKIEKELTPHFELLPLATPDPPTANR